MPTWQGCPLVQAGHAPPQSIPVSFPSFTPSWQDGATHRPSALQTSPPEQSASVTHVAPAPPELLPELVLPLDPPLAVPELLPEPVPPLDPPLAVPELLPEPVPPLDPPLVVPELLPEPASPLDPPLAVPELLPESVPPLEPPPAPLELFKEPELPASDEAFVEPPVDALPVPPELLAEPVPSPAVPAPLPPAPPADSLDVALPEPPLESGSGLMWDAPPQAQRATAQPTTIEETTQRDDVEPR